MRNPWLWALAAVFLIDAFFYLDHRIQHAVPLVWLGTPAKPNAESGMIPNGIPG